MHLHGVGLKQGRSRMHLPGVDRFKAGEVENALAWRWFKAGEVENALAWRRFKAGEVEKAIAWR